MEPKIKREENSNMKVVDLQKITPFIWFDHQALQAAEYYTSIFKNSNIKGVNYYGESASLASGMEKGSILTVDFIIEGQEFVALNGGPVFQITPAISFFIHCDSLHEIDTLWQKLIDGGSVLMELNEYPFAKKYGWLVDKFGVNWQLILSSDPQKIIPSFLFQGKLNGKAEEAMNFYTSLFKNSKITTIQRYEPNEGSTPGTIKYARFSIESQDFVTMDTSMDQPFTFTPGISLVINCENQEEIDHFWDHLTQGGDEKAQQCGWLQDKYGISWQVVPAEWTEMMHDPDPAKTERIMKAIIPMKKLDINAIRKAYNGQ